MNTGIVLVDVAVKDLSGAALDWVVAKALGFVDYPEDSVEQGGWWYTNPVKAPFCERIRKADWNPSTDWRQGGPLIEQHKVMVVYHEAPDRTPLATTESRHPAFESGETILIAACRAIVAAVLGDIVKVPACLVLP